MNPSDVAQMQDQAARAQGIGMIGMVIYLLVIAFFVVCGWKIFAKAGKPGWAVLVPIYNIIVMMQIVGRPMWWLILFFIPLVNFVISIILTFDTAKVFGKSVGFGFGLLLLGFIFYPILAFGDAKYVAPAAPAAPAAA